MKDQNQLTNVFILVLFFTAILAQNGKAQSEFGVKGGILFSNFNVTNNNSNVEFEKKDGLSAGLFYQSENLLGPVGFRSELLYQMKGTNYFIEKMVDLTNVDTGSPDYFDLLNAPKSYYRSDEKLHYFSIPLLLTVNTTKFLDLYAGPELGYLFSFKNKRESTGEMKRFSAGIAMGATVKLCDKTSLDFRYSTDFTTFDKLGKNSSTNMKNYGFSITIQQTLFRKQ
jgi:hypothetical protein